MFEFLTNSMDILKDNVFLFAFIISMYFNIQLIQHCIAKGEK